MESLPDIDPGVRPGDVLAGKYQVERVLGAGGMGVVVAAHHIQLDEKVALKFLLPAALLNPEALARFEREARAAVKIKSEHVARVIDVGKLENGAPYMVMEYLEGSDLSTVLEQQGHLPVEQAVDFVLQAAEAIAEAHSLGIVHRDLKPSNLFCIRRRDGQLSIKLLDFGISKVTIGMGPGSGSQDMGMTRTASVMGSPSYMSPEQMKSSRSVDARTDIWSLGVILFQLLTDRLPFAGESLTELAIQIATEPAPAPTALRADLPPGLDKVVLRCLEKDPARRYPHVGELAAGLVKFGSGRARASLDRIHGILGMAQTMGFGGAATNPTAPSRPLGAQSGSTVAPWQSSARINRGGMAIGIAGAVAVAAVLVGGLLLLRRSPATETATGVGPASAVSAPLSSASFPAATPPGVDETAAPSALPPSTSPAPSSSAPPSASTVRHPAPAPHHANPAAKPKVDCSTPYYFDAQGNRAFKKECL